MIIPKGPRPWRAWLSAFVWYAHITPLWAQTLDEVEERQWAVV